jgi:hypothetical protein
VSRAPAAARPRAPRAAPLARAALAVLVAASVGAFFIAQALKREAPLLKRPRGYTARFQPAGDGHPFDRAAHFDVEATVGDVLDVSVLTLSGRVVDVIAPRLVVHEYRSVLLSWAGTTSAGTPAPAGLYELRVRFERAGQTVIVPGFRLALKGRSA